MFVIQGATELPLVTFLSHTFQSASFIISSQRHPVFSVEIFRFHLIGKLQQRMMKPFFNWVHRKFHLDVESHSFSRIRDGVGEKLKKFETVTSESDTDALLDHSTLAEGWKDGLLSIGTLGFDPLEPHYLLNGDFVDQTDDDDVAEEEEEEGGKEELETLMVKGFKRGFDEVLLSSSASARKPDLSTTVDDDIDTPLLRFLDSPELQTDHGSLASKENKKKKKGERTTLADLFSEEADTTAAAAPGNSDTRIVHQSGCLEKTSCSSSRLGLSFTKKFLSRKENDSLPITKLHQLIKKMVKKKIHPDQLEGKVHGMNGAPIITLESEKGDGDNATSRESWSLL